MSNKKNIAIIQFPGSNTERETFMACRRSGLNPVEFLWNELTESLSAFHGYIIVGGFSYEDRSRAGIIAALDPIMRQIKIEADNGKPVLGICNGAQILVESGLVPGLKNYHLGAALTDNKRVKGDVVVGVGYYNTWANLKMSVTPNRCAFTRHFKKGDLINIPLAHGEGRFIFPDELLDKMISNEQTVYRYSNYNGNIIDEFPINPNGSMYNIAAICNPAGNVMAMMPHPERTENGDAIFSSMKNYIESDCPAIDNELFHEVPNFEIKQYEPRSNSIVWAVDMIITDNEAESVKNALNKLGHDVSIKRQTHWEISLNKNHDKAIEQIIHSGELYNSNKEFISEINGDKNTSSLLIRQKEDMYGRVKFESLTKRFKIKELIELKRGIIWNVSVNGGNFKSVMNDILNTNILFNPLSYECYEIK